MAALLEIHNLGFSRGGRPILSGFDMRMEAGEHLLLLGASGSGKTSLLNLVAGLLTPDEGSIRIAGTDMPRQPAARDALRRRHIGIIFQTLRLVSALSLRGNLQLAARLAGRPADDIPALLDRLGIAHRADALPRQLSHGEAQRAAIARALIARPALLLADEPTSALDDGNAREAARLLLDMAESHGSTLLIATHDSRLKPFFARTLALGAA